MSSSLVLGAVGVYYLGKRFVSGRETRPYSAALMGVTAFLMSLNVLVFSQSTRGQEAMQSYAGLADIYEVAKYAGIGSAAVVALGVALLLLYRKGIVSGSRFSP
jgi:Mn2+/Fe2+ NRAMP family transporter